MKRALDKAPAGVSFAIRPSESEPTHHELKGLLGIAVQAGEDGFRVVNQCSLKFA
jgi:hypothetical protein